MGASCDEEAPASAAKEQLLAAPPSRSHVADVHVLSAAFLSVFSAYGAAQNLQSTINTEGNLGTVSLAIMYTSMTLFSVAASPVVRWLGARRALLVGTTGFPLFILANLVPMWCVIWTRGAYVDVDSVQSISMCCILS
ncbi:hypothetical protein ACQ4PT_013265 [Festuca glaucescens]